jgi:hypothetical protein
MRLSLWLDWWMMIEKTSDVDCRFLVLPRSAVFGMCEVIEVISEF